MLAVPIALNRGRPLRLVLVHGFTQTSAVWSELAERFGALGFEVLAPDLPGHGVTDPTFDGHDLLQSARELVTTCGGAVYLGYSLGARVVLHAALSSELKSQVQAAVLVGANLGFSEHEAAVRRMSDEALAKRIESLASSGRFDEFIDEWLSGPVNAYLAGSAKDVRFRVQRQLRLANRPGGLAESLRHAGSGTQSDLRAALQELSMPALFVEGEFDLPSIKGQAAGAVGLAGAPAETAVVKDCGHASPFEDPDQFFAVVSGFLAQLATKHDLRYL